MPKTISLQNLDKIITGEEKEKEGAPSLCEKSCVVFFWGFDLFSSLVIYLFDITISKPFGSLPISTSFCM